MHVRTIAVLFIGLLLGGCSWFGGSKNRPSEFDLQQLQRAQWETLAQQGDAEAQYQLGLSYCCGYDAHRTALAGKWLCSAALQGHPGAQFQLGQLFGFRTLKNRPMSMPSYLDYADFWYSLAAAQGYELAKNYRAAIEPEMTPPQLARAREWQKTPQDHGC